MALAALALVRALGAGSSPPVTAAGADVRWKNNLSAADGEAGGDGSGAVATCGGAPRHPWSECWEVGDHGWVVRPWGAELAPKGVGGASAPQ